MKFDLSEIVLYLYKSTFQPFVEYCRRVWTDGPNYDLNMLDKLQKRIYRAVGPAIAIRVGTWTWIWP